jgi:hypothetical protein
MDTWEREQAVDFDVLLKMGVKLREREGVDRTAVAWLEASPTPKRVDIACALLYGFWLPRDELSEQVDAKLLARLIKAKGDAMCIPRGKRRFDPVPDANYSFALALERVLSNPSTSHDALQLAAAAMQASMDATTGDKGLDRSLLELGNKSLSKARARLNQR